MKHFNLIILLLFASLVSGGQQPVREEANGLFYDNNNRLYSGIFREYYPDGTLRMEMPLRKGAINGDVVIYYNDQSRNEIRAYKSGKMHGRWITWAENGVMIAEANYLKGRKNGKWLIWDENGVLRYNMTYRQGEKKGTWYMYDEKGILVMEQTYK